MNGCRKRCEDLGTFDDEEIDSDVDAAAFRRAVEEGRMTIKDSILVIAADPDRSFGLGDGLEEVFGEPGDIIDIQVREFAVGLSEVEDHNFSAGEIEGYNRSHLTTMGVNGGNDRF